jgi:hypothetical protein
LIEGIKVKRKRFRQGILSVSGQVGQKASVFIPQGLGYTLPILPRAKKPVEEAEGGEGGGGEELKGPGHGGRFDK